MMNDDVVVYQGHYGSGGFIMHSLWTQGIDGAAIEWCAKGVTLSNVNKYRKEKP